jgi:predicted dithiol-disulfide oxidoreductase (DUF899 family)
LHCLTARLRQRAKGFVRAIGVKPVECLPLRGQADERIPLDVDDRELQKGAVHMNVKNSHNVPDSSSDTHSTAMPPVVDRATYQAAVDKLRVREKAHTHEGDAIAAARRRLPMIEMEAATPLVGKTGAVRLLDVFEGLRQLIAYYFMWHTGKPAPEQCEGCTWVTSQVRELAYVHSRDVTFAVFCQGPYDESARYRDFMGWELPWYSAQQSLTTLLAPPKRPGRMHLVCYLRDGSRVFETYWTTIRGVEAMDNNYRLLDLTVYGRQETWEDSPAGWPQTDNMDTLRSNGRPRAQWSRVNAGYSDDLRTNSRTAPNSTHGEQDHSH